MPAENDAQCLTAASRNYNTAITKVVLKHKLVIYDAIHDGMTSARTIESRGRIIEIATRKWTKVNRTGLTPLAVAKDNTVVMERVVIQLNKQPERGTCAGMKVLVRRHLDSTYSVWKGQHLLGTYDKHGEPIGRTADAKKKETRSARLTG